MSLYADHAPGPTMTQESYPPAGHMAPCFAHPDMATNLRCSRCEKPICPRCLVQTPVGARCRDCAQLRRLPVFEVSAPIYAKAAVVSVVAGLVTGSAWSFFPLGGFFTFLMCAGAGYVIGEAVSRSVHRRQSRWLKFVAVGGVIIAYIGHVVFPLVIAISGIPGGVQLSQGLAIVAAAMAGVAGQPFAWLAIAVGGVVAAGRID